MVGVLRLTTARILFAPAVPDPTSEVRRRRVLQPSACCSPHHHASLCLSVQVDDPLGQEGLYCTPLMHVLEMQAGGTAVLVAAQPTPGARGSHRRNPPPLCAADANDSHGHREGRAAQRCTAPASPAGLCGRGVPLCQNHPARAGFCGRQDPQQADRGPPAAYRSQPWDGCGDGSPSRPCPCFPEQPRQAHAAGAPGLRATATRTRHTPATKRLLLLLLLLL